MLRSLDLKSIKRYESLHYKQDVEKTQQNQSVKDVIAIVDGGLLYLWLLGWHPGSQMDANLRWHDNSQE
jgi:hypothetical protein